MVHYFTLGVVCEDKKGFWNEAADVVADLASNWARLKEEKIRDCVSRFRDVIDWLITELNGVKHLTFDDTTMLAVKRRMLRGHHPRQERGTNIRLLEADLLIIETLAARFQQGKDGANLLLCTENVKDFALRIGEANSLHSAFTFELPPTEVFTDLVSLLEFIEKNVSVHEPTKEQIEEAARIAEEERIVREMSWQPSYLTPSTATSNPALRPTVVVPFPLSDDHFLYDPQTGRYYAVYPGDPNQLTFGQYVQQQEAERQRRHQEFQRAATDAQHRTIQRNRENSDPGRPPG